MSSFRCAPMQRMCLSPDGASRRSRRGYAVHGGLFADSSSSIDVFVGDPRSVCGALRKRLIRFVFAYVNS